MKILVLVAHPALEKSRVHRALLARVPRRPGITVHDLYEAYPRFDIDVEREQELLAAHDLLVVQHPFFWYSTPALVKQWEDLVLEHGWAYGRGGTALHGKYWLHAISAGGREAAYQHEGYNRFTIRELLAPLEQTARLCGMHWVPPYVIHGTHRLEESDIARAADDYASLLAGLADDEIDLRPLLDAPTLNAAVGRGFQPPANDLPAVVGLQPPANPDLDSRSGRTEVLPHADGGTEVLPHTDGGTEVLPHKREDPNR